VIVVDTNVLAYLYLPGEWTQMSEQLLRQDPQWIAPRLWRSEFCNVLAMYLRRQQLSLAQAQEIQQAAEQLMGNRNYSVSTSTVLELSQQSRCSAYDCEFVALAQQYQIPLVTIDSKVLGAFPNIAQSLQTFLNA
jgi:predicted nucleic acid-binding protein